MTKSNEIPYVECELIDLDETHKPWFEDVKVSLFLPDVFIPQQNGNKNDSHVISGHN